MKHFHKFIFQHLLSLLTHCFYSAEKLVGHPQKLKKNYVKTQYIKSLRTNHAHGFNGEIQKYSGF